MRSKTGTRKSLFLIYHKATATLVNPVRVSVRLVSDSKAIVCSQRLPVQKRFPFFTCVTKLFPDRLRYSALSEGASPGNGHTSMLNEECMSLLGTLENTVRDSTHVL